MASLIQHDVFKIPPCCCMHWQHSFLLLSNGGQSWLFTGRTDAEAENSILWPPDGKSRLIGKDPDAGKDWRREEKGTTEDERAGWHHWLNGHGFGWTPGAGDGQGGLACSGPRGHTDSDTPERLSWPELSSPLYGWPECVLSWWLRL